MNKATWRLRLLALAACLVIAGCAPGGNSSDEDRRGGFYGGLSGGMTWAP